MTTQNFLIQIASAAVVKLRWNRRSVAFAGEVVRTFTLAILCMFLIFFPSLFAEEENVIEFRRVFVPEEQIPSLSLGPSLPMNRQQFESQIERFNQQSEQQSDQQPYLSKIVLRAKLEDQQLTSGQGAFTLHPRAGGSPSIPFDPLTLPIHSVRWSDNTDAVLYYAPDSGNRLLVPSPTDSNSYDHIQFRWSLQSRHAFRSNDSRSNDSRNGIMFDISLPPCLSVELQIELPEALSLTSSAGLVFLSEENTTPRFRTWQVSLGHHSSTTLTIVADQSLPSIKPKLAIRQTMIYAVRPEGLGTETQIAFDAADSRPDQLLLELEMPLRPVDVLYGNRPAPWTLSAISPGITEVLVDLSSFSEKEPQELKIMSLGPLRENQRWTLPRVRVTSSDVFWLETRCGVNVYSPLRTRNLIYDQAVQVSPLSSTNVNWAERELFIFQLFQDDAQIELEVGYSIPHITVNSFVQTEWSDSELRGTVFLHCSVTEGERFALNFPVSEHWVIDSVDAYPPPAQVASVSGDDPIFTWDVLEGTQRLSVQLNRPLDSRSSVMLKLSCRFINSSQSQFLLAELSPLMLPHRHGETHFIATQSHLTTYSLKSSMDASVFDVPSLTLGGNSLPSAGAVYPLDFRTQDICFELERMSPNYTVEIFGNNFIDSTGLTATFRINCTPIDDSSISRVIIHFTPSGDTDTSRHWNFSLMESTGSPRPLQARKILPEELQEVFSMSEQQNWSENLERGELWEIRFDDSQTASFELTAVSLIPLADTISLPLASVPLASAQRGELTIESPQQFHYRIVHARLDSIPVAPPAWDQYQTTRAAFRYNPSEELRRSHPTLLLLQKLTPNEQADIAWVWSLRLDSQYDPIGIVRNRALFLVENQGKDVLKIKLPRGIDATNVSSVWRDSQQIPWQYNADQGDADQGAINVALPEGQRFVSISVEYAYHDAPLSKQRKLRPHSPSADVPILSGSWISWFPPEFEVSLRRANNDDSPASTGSVSVSKTLEYLLSGTYRSFLGAEWHNIFDNGRRRLETESAAQYFFEGIVDVLDNNPLSTWGELLGRENEKILAYVRSRLTDTRRFVETKLFIDKQALSFLGITPTTPIEGIGTIRDENVRKNLFEQAGLVLLVAARTRSDGTKEYVFAITTPITLSLNRHFQPVSAGHCVRIVPFEIFDSNSKSSPEWILASRWLSETTLSSAPWLLSTQVMQWTALSSDWHAYELPITTEQPLYIVHRQKFLALQWIAFLSLVLISSRKPFSSPIALFALLILFEVIARSVAPCYVGIPSGAFLGVLVSWAFMLIRSKAIVSDAPLELPRRDDSTECSVSFVPVPLTLRSLLLCASLIGTLLIGLSTSVIAQPIPVSAQIVSRKEPYTVIYPTDSEGHFVGEYVYPPLEFFYLLSSSTLTESQAVSQRGHIIKALYQGSLVRGTSGQIECADDFKAVFDVHLDSSHAVITLPNLPAIPGRFLWNSRPIQPIRESEANGMLSFQITNETPGKHTLEVALSPKINGQNADVPHPIAFPIPKVPQSTLRLNAPPEVRVDVPDAQGAITPNTTLTPVLTAELGAAEQLSLSWIDDPNRSGSLVREVEQFFWIHVKPTQIELQALFRFRIDGGTVQHLTIQTDPLWSRSGQFRCDEGHTIVSRTEPATELRSLGSLADSSSNVLQIDFQSPVAGIVTLRANFVLQDFNVPRNLRVYGNLRLPEFRALQSRMTKSMLAVSADPVLVELTLPAEGRSSGFLSGWYGTSMESSPLLGESPLWEFAEQFVRRNDAARERPDAEYDLIKTEPNWTVNVRTRKTVPKVSVTQSVQLDANESKIHILGEFESVSPIFRQQFSAERPIQIESITVRNSEDVLIETRYQQIAPEQYLIFFKSPVTEKYAVTIRGFFETAVQEEQTLQAVPLLTFDGAQTTAHSLNFFRTSSVLSEISSEQSAWTKTSAVPDVPESFAQSIPLGNWRKTESTGSVLPATAVAMDVRAEPPRFVLSPNRPTVKSKTVLTFQSADRSDGVMVLDFTGTITGGELKSLSFRWDERCGTIQSLEPAVPWSLGLSGGQQMLTLTPAELMQGEQRFKITTAINVTGTAVSLPNVFPLERGIYALESEVFVSLPLKHDDEIIPWELERLEMVEEQSAGPSRSFYRATDTQFSATISQIESRLTAVFYDIAFLIKRNGVMLGSATVDLQNRGQDSFVLQMPPGYEPIQISCAGTMLDRTPTGEENRWHIHIGTSDYPQRLHILFRTTLSSPPQRWNRNQVISWLKFPILEGVVIQETLWSIAFEGEVPTLGVRLGTEGDEMEDLETHSPIFGSEAVLSVVGVNLIREHNLIQILRTLPVSPRQEEMQRSFAHWLDEWNAIADKVNSQIPYLSSRNVKPKLILRSVGSELIRPETTGTIRAFWGMMGAGTQEALRVSMEQSVQEKFGVATDTVSRQPGQVVNSQVYWQGGMSEEMQYLFGVEGGIMRTIQLTSQPEEETWTDWLSEHVLLGIVLALMLPVFVLMSVRWVHPSELWLQFPHFWGMTLGVFLWTFLPESFLGSIIIVLTFVSLLRPSWNRSLSIIKPL